MSGVVKMRRCDGLTVFHVSREPLQPGEQLRRYYMHQYAQLIARIQSVLEGATALAHYLSGPEWRQLNIENEITGQKSESLKMMIVLEAIFEGARVKMAPSLPSRLDCIFAWSSLELARRFRVQYLPEGTIHRCHVIEGLAVELDGGLLPPGINLKKLSLKALSDEIRTTQARAEKYWKAQTSFDFPELLIQGSVEIVDLVQK